LIALSVKIILDQLISIMANLYELHPSHPQQRTIEQIVTALKKGAV